ncbi:iron transporter [Formosa sp. Hel3_A1_48]|uniref:Nramp family divalent metal transporter n=1 Tax=Formosa sp. Hel3_A1_48 TaxID=1336795 RepID=UPI00084E1E52|nr:Nramp family divalent metal transporter [Formosa sp. Hel3_A1_48]AOR25829.1 iron transporter [Formosa sp. Hel3_A1_48]MDC0951020.1 Nramp family divalent metal transporter [Flavobacteriaceae bacterium]
MTKFLQNLGPGLLFAGAAIGVSHLVQSTKAGANFGFGLLWALLLINLIKYPFFQFGPRYAAATGESLLEGYNKLGKGVLKAYALLTIATMFTIQTAVTIVTAGIASTLFGSEISMEIWSVIILSVCFLLLLVGKYSLLDKMMKVIIIVLSLSTLFAVAAAFINSTNEPEWTQIVPSTDVELIFLIAFMGWMPAPLDVSIWHSIWAIQKKKQEQNFNSKTAALDFNIGYLGTIVLGIGFLMLGGLVMHGSGKSFSANGGEFSLQLIEMYTQNLGEWSYIIIVVAALTTMFSTTLTTLDASPRAMNKTLELILDKPLNNGYKVWLIVLIIGTISIFFFFLSEMGSLIKIATILSFLTAPFYALMNYILICSKHTPQSFRPSKMMHFLSISGILFLIGFNIWYISIL